MARAVPIAPLAPLAPLAPRAALAAALCAAVLSGACRQDMHDSARHEALEHTPFFADGRVDRPLVEGTVARGRLFADEHLHSGVVAGEPAESFPFPIDRARLERGRERYGIFCAPCHDALGTGQGAVVQRGFKAPESLHVERLRKAPPGYFFDVTTRGFGAMAGYAERVPAEDRWAIAAWIRVLQQSRRGRIEDVPEPERARLLSVPKESR